MRKGLKIILIVIGFVIFAFLLTIIKALQGQSSSSSGVGGPIGIILMVAFIAGARAIWKYNPDKNTNDTDKHELDKK